MHFLVQLCSTFQMLLDACVVQDAFLGGTGGTLSPSQKNSITSNNSSNNVAPHPPPSARNPQRRIILQALPALHCKAVAVMTLYHGIMNAT